MERERLRQYYRDYRARNKERIAANDRARLRRIPAGERRAYWREYRRTHPETAEQKARHLLMARALYKRKHVERNRKRRERWASRRVRPSEVYIPESTWRMEVEAEMWIAKAEGRDPEQAKRAWVSREASWRAKTVLLRTPEVDGPLFSEEKGEVA